MRKLINDSGINYSTKNYGFNLIELLIAVAIVAILAAVVYPSYVGSVAESNRTEAQRELLRIANLQEQFYIDFRRYTNDMSDLGLGADPFITDQGNYSIDATINQSTFTLTATATGNQKTNDASCQLLTVDETGQKSPSTCWE